MNCVFQCIVCKCVLYDCHRASTQLQLTNISIYGSAADAFARLKTHLERMNSPQLRFETWNYMKTNLGVSICFIHTEDKRANGVARTVLISAFQKCKHAYSFWRKSLVHVACFTEKC